MPNPAVGFVMGTKGTTLRELETRHRAFMFFDNELVRDDKKRLYVIGEKKNRRGARDETKAAIELKMSGRGVRVPSWQDFRVRTAPSPSLSPVLLPSVRSDQGRSIVLDFYSLHSRARIRTGRAGNLVVHVPVLCCAVQGGGGPSGGMRGPPPRGHYDDRRGRDRYDDRRGRDRFDDRRRDDDFGRDRRDDRGE